VHAVDLDELDFAALGRVLGCEGAAVDDEGSLGDALDRGFATDRPTVLHLREGGPSQAVTAGAEARLTTGPGG
jgi:thiamine pyrophosphate-dependent acetolactate synthase large subunit-like protein